MSEKNCWEFRKCGRESGGAHVNELGTCPAATEARANGINGGKNGGRTCWAICGTMCGGKVLGTYAAKISTCRSCEFYQSVQRDLQLRALSLSEHPSKILDIVLERTAALEDEVEQRMRVEEAIRQANTKLNLLSSITRHDTLNKLNSIILLTEIISRNYEHDPVLFGYLSKMDRQVQDLVEIANFTSDYQDLGIHAPVWQSLRGALSGIGKPAHSLPVEIDPGLDRYEIFADPLLSRVFYNLADNALRHGERVSHIIVQGDLRPDGLVVLWEDDGIGILPMDKEKIFAKGQGRNTGLGLFLAREILSITGITIRETGIPGKGARFEMVVPMGSFRLVGST